MSDRIARGALAGARDAGLDLLGDLSVVGFDDDPEADRAKTPLTTVRQPHVEKGRAAGNLLVSRLQRHEANDPVLLSTALIVRAPTAPPP